MDSGAFIADVSICGYCYYWKTYFSLFICACLLKRLDILYQNFMNLSVYEEGWGWERPEIYMTRAGWCSHSWYWLHWMQFLKMLNFRIYGQWHWLHLKFSWIFFLWSRPHPNVMIYYKIVYHVIAQPLAKSHKIFSRWIADVS